MAQYNDKPTSKASFTDTPQLQAYVDTDAEFGIPASHHNKRKKSAQAAHHMRPVAQLLLWHEVVGLQPFRRLLCTCSRRLNY